MNTTKNIKSIQLKLENNEVLTIRADGDFNIANEFLRLIMQTYRNHVKQVYITHYDQGKNKEIVELNDINFDNTPINLEFQIDNTVISFSYEVDSFDDINTKTKFMEEFYITLDINEDNINSISIELEDLDLKSTNTVSFKEFMQIINMTFEAKRYPSHKYYSIFGKKYLCIEISDYANDSYYLTISINRYK